MPVLLIGTTQDVIDALDDKTRNMIPRLRQSLARVLARMADPNARHGERYRRCQYGGEQQNLEGAHWREHDRSTIIRRVCMHHLRPLQELQGLAEEWRGRLGNDGVEVVVAWLEDLLNEIEMEHAPIWERLFLLGKQAHRDYDHGQLTNEDIARTFLGHIGWVMNEQNGNVTATRQDQTVIAPDVLSLYRQLAEEAAGQLQAAQNINHHDHPDGNAPVGNDPIYDTICRLRAKSHRSWRNLAKACRERLQPQSQQWPTTTVRRSALDVVGKMKQRTRLDYAQILQLLIDRGHVQP